MRIRLCLLLLTIAIASFAQTQQGIVKTRGRMVNGQLVAGQRLSGATVTLNFGNALVSGGQGAFSFNVPAGKSYSLVMAKKQGYTLADPEYTKRSFKYSASNPFYVVLEDEAQRQADINAATRKVRRTLTAQLQKREDEIEELKAQNKLTEAEYQKRLQELYDNQSKSEQLVKEMAERYVATDYDQLDEFNSQVQMYIEEGELQKADSMIRSKGDMEQRVAEYHNVIAANKERQERLEREQEELEQSEKGALLTYEDLQQDLFRRHEIYLHESKRDSALYCLKLRADLDTTKAGPASDYADLCCEEGKYEESEEYYFISIRAVNSDADALYKSFSLAHLAAMYDQLKNYRKSEEYYLLAIDSQDDFAVVYPKFVKKFVAICYNGIAVVYKELKDYDNYKKYRILTVETYEEIFRDNPDESRKYKGYFATALYRLGKIYLNNQEYEKSFVYLSKAVQHFDILLAEEDDTYNEIFGVACNSLAYAYAYLNRLDEALSTIDKAIALMPTDANYYDSKGEILLMQGKNDEALAMWKKILELNTDFLKYYPDGTNLSNGLKKLGLIE